MSKYETPFFKKIAIITLYLIYLIDSASVVLVLVVFSQIVLSDTSTFLPPTTSIVNRNLILGFLYATYPLTQFLGAPILGELSDRLGKRKILNISTLGAAFSYFFTALCILNHNLPLLFISRLLAGFFAGNAAIAQASVSSIVQKKRRSNAMAFFTVLGGIGWILGPFLGGLLSNPKIVHWFSIATPFWLFGFIFLTCWGLLLLSFDPQFIKGRDEKLSIVQCFKNIASIFKLRIIVAPFLSCFIMMFGMMIADTFFAPFLMQKFHFDYIKVGYAFAYIAAWWLIGGIFSMILFKFVKPSKMITAMVVIASIFIFIYVMDKTPYFIYWAGAIANFSFSFAYASFIALFSHVVPNEMQGKLYGASAGSFALANTIAPAFAGWISFLGINVPIAIGSVFILTAAMIYLSWEQRYKKTIAIHEK